jgi:hypothetical protein
MKQQHSLSMRMCAVGAILTLAAGCSWTDDLLEVDNPEAIKVQSLDDPALLDVQLNGVIDQFSGTYASPVMEYGQYATDEVLSGLNWEDYARVNQRIISYLEGPTAGIFEGLSRGLRMGNDLAERIRGWDSDDPDEDLRPQLATALVFAGYSAVVMGEYMCQSVISPDPDNPSGDVLEQPDIFDAAMPYLTEALSVATAVGDDDLTNLARTGLARAHIGKAEWSDAANFANMVAPSFEWWIDFVDASGGRNPLQNTSHGGNFTLGIHPEFTGVHPSFDGTGLSFLDDVVDPQTDPRIQHWPSDRTGHNGLTPLYKLFQGLRYSQYTGETISDTCGAGCTGTSEDDMMLIAEYDTDVLLADYVEAQHQYFEALCPNATTCAGNEAAVLTFVNARRAVGNQAAVTFSGQDLVDELRRQRAKDLFMGGFRMGDLRRWTRYDPGNGPFAAGSYFPTGTHPNAQWGDYGPWTCFPIPLSEYEGNANLTKPLDPNVPPAI